MARSFAVVKAERTETPLFIGLAGFAGSGKTYSALRLATGMTNVYGGDVCMIDTEGGRGRHYADAFDYQYIEFAPPFSPLRYKDAIDAAIESNAKVIIVDSMSHEHSGEGGVLDQADTFLSERAGDDWKKRERLKFAAWSAPKAQRRKLNNALIAYGARAAFIFCYRAEQKLRIGKTPGGKTDIHTEWSLDSTSGLKYEMTQTFLLRPGADGAPVVRPETPDEAQIVKRPAQFRDWFTDDFVLDERVGERLAKWAKGEAFEHDQLVREFRALYEQLSGPDITALGIDKAVTDAKEIEQLKDDWLRKGIKKMGAHMESIGG